MRFIIFSFLTFLLIGGPSTAAPEAEQVSFSFRCIGLGSEFRQMDLWVDNGSGGKRERIRMGTASKTPSISYTGLPQLVFFRQAEGGERFAQVLYNPNLKDPLYIFTSLEGKQGARITTIEDSWSVYGANTYLLVNISGRDLYWQMGTERFKIEDTDFKVIDVPKSVEKTPVIALEIDEEGTASRVYRAKWQNRPNMRRLIFVREADENETGSVRVRVVEDFNLNSGVSS